MYFDSTPLMYRILFEYHSAQIACLTFLYLMTAKISGFPTRLDTNRPVQIENSDTENRDYTSKCVCVGGGGGQRHNTVNYKR